MTPAVSPGDHFFMEGVTYPFRAPHRGDIVIFKTEGLDGPDKSAIFVKRVAGLPGERLRLMDGKLLLNDTLVSLRNAAGEINYANMGRTPFLPSSNNSVTVPAGHYFVLGDNSNNSFDSRYWGFLPARNIKGQASFRYMPADRIGFPK